MLMLFRGDPSHAPPRRILAALVVVATGALAAIACIPPGTYTLAPCTETATPGDLQAKINAAGSGAVICMDAGVFRGSVLFQGKSGVTLRGQGQKATVITGGAVDGLLAFHSQNLTFQDFTLSGGHPTDAYISNSQNVAFQGVAAEGGGIGVHFDAASTGTITSSLIHNVDADGLLVRNGSAVRVDHSLIFDNGGAGVSAVGAAATMALDTSVISHNAGPGVFAGQVPCAPLPGGRLDVPPCYLGNPQAFVSGIHVTLSATVVQESGSTGVVLFPGTNATFSGNHIVNNRLTGVFVWGATLSSQGDEFSGNEEHAVELRAYPSPLQPVLLSAVGTLTGDDVHDSVVLAATRTLGGGVLAQGARVDVINSRVHNNRGIGISFVNGSTGSAVNDQIYDNRGSALCLSNAGAVSVTGSSIAGNASDAPGVCRETT
jgi:hypothetical protein